MRPSTEAARWENGNLNRGARNAWGLRLQNCLMPEALTCLCLNVAVVGQAQFAPSQVLLAALVGGSAHHQECRLQHCHSCDTPRCPQSPRTESCSIVLFACTHVFPHPWSARSSLVAISPSCPLRLHLHRLGPKQQAVVPDSLHCAHHLQPRVPTFRHNFR
jgi:hypothetical protein